jgi:hypothetical protein
MKNINILYKKLLITTAYRGISLFSTNQKIKQMSQNTVIPLISYKAINLEKSLILKDNKGKSGVYRLTNSDTGAIYIGSAIDLSRRLRDYFSVKFLKKEILKNNSLIYRALLKHGYESFTLDILEYCDKTQAISKEQHYIDLLKPEYNLCLKAGSSLGRITREETRLKLRNV